jgi:hypothetical protein
VPNEAVVDAPSPVARVNPYQHVCDVLARDITLFRARGCRCSLWGVEVGGQWRAVPVHAIDATTCVVDHARS